MYSETLEVRGTCIWIFAGHLYFYSFQVFGIGMWHEGYANSWRRLLVESHGQVLKIIRLNMLS